jgi:transcriptional regulator with XRE-family HTH domain
MTKTELGQKIRERRKTLGISQRELADYTGLSIVILSLIENGKTNPSFETLSEILYYLNLKISLDIRK